ncbi:hypothetical protein HK101_001496 [Irineochytrium annulatum]|nr:hypothetical protein HK101_001496 [Irineochytrium annulatum]
MPSNVIIVTGGVRGIGAAIAKELAAVPDTALVITHRHSGAERASSTLSELHSLGATESIAVRVDLSNPEEIGAFVDGVVARFGPAITALVNNAGVYMPGRIEAETAERFAAVFEGNVRSNVLLTSAVLPHMRDDGRGSIVNVSSALTHRPSATSPAALHVASKGAVEALTRALAVELAPRGIRVNAVSPGLTDTEMLPREYVEAGARETPLGRIATPEDIAKVVAFLVSEKAGWMTGQNLIASGGTAFTL